MKILIVDDEKSIRVSLVMSFRKLGMKVDDAENGKIALEKCLHNNYDLVITDIKMPEIGGIELLKKIKQMNKSVIVIMMTHLGEVKFAVDAMKLGAYDYFTKPFSIEEMMNIALEIKEKLTKQQITVDQEPVMIGSSSEIKKIYDKIDKLSQVKFTTAVLIEGESGTGKELIARMIGTKCAPDKPFVAINCAAIPEHLQESELFGHEKGAFSDAKSTRKGLFEHAGEGVIFLDEIGDMDMDLQAKLLRVLQEKKIRRIGGNEEIDMKALVIAATNKNLKEEVLAGKFRKDLFYRLNVIPIKLPPLRERPEDISLLIQYFMDYYNLQFGKQVNCISDELRKNILRYDWPGNVRELKNIMERLIIFNDGSCLSESELPYELDVNGSEFEKTSLESAEHEVIIKALSKHRWNITRTAEALGISRLTLRRKIDKYDLNR